jgi:hypothetical protein
MLGRAPVHPVLVILGLLLVTGVTGVTIIHWLGFGRPPRHPDWMLWTALIVPIAGAAAFRLLPLVARRSRRSKTVVLQTAGERWLDWGSLYAKAAALVILAVALAAALWVAKARNHEHAALKMLARDFAAARRSWYEVAAKTDILATRASGCVLLRDRDKSIQIKQEYEEMLLRLRSRQQDILGLLDSQTVLAGHPSAAAFLERLQALGRVADTYLGYQIRTLGDERPSLSEEAEGQKRLGLVRVLQNYLKLWAKDLLEADDLASALQKSIERSVLDFERSWLGVVVSASSPSAAK